MEKYDAKALLTKYKEGNCTDEEIAFLESWYLTDNNLPIDLTTEEINNAKDKVWASLPVHQYKVKTHQLWSGFSKLTAAAVVLICLSLGFYFWKSNRSVLPQQVANTQILPGGKKATLTLADGTMVSLAEAGNGKIGNQAGADVFKTADGEISYNAGGESEQPTLQYNLLSIPNGGYYTLTLVDGTKVWLNSASTLKYPTQFNGPDRIVELTGEGYFEVAHRDHQPFKVLTKHQTVEVIGTHFNINAYDDEIITATTLLQGSVKVTTKNGNNKTLVPGKQSRVVGNDITIHIVDTDNAVAWTNNGFHFSNEELSSIMRKISRWYDVEVVCPPAMAEMEFSGSISRATTINQVLKIMEITGTVHFKFEGRRITVMP